MSEPFRRIPGTQTFVLHKDEGLVLLDLYAEAAAAFNRRDAVNLFYRRRRHHNLLQLLNNYRKDFVNI